MINENCINIKDKHFNHNMKGIKESSNINLTTVSKNKANENSQRGKTVSSLGQSKSYPRGAASIASKQAAHDQQRRHQTGRYSGEGGLDGAKTGRPDGVTDGGEDGRTGDQHRRRLTARTLPRKR